MKRVIDLAIGLEYEAALVPTAASLATAGVGDMNIIDVATNVAAVAGTVERAAILTVCANSDGEKFFRTSLPIHSENVTSYPGVVSYVEEDPKQITFDISALVPVEDREYALFITDENDFNYIIGRRRISYVATAADVATGFQAVVDGLVSAINGDVSLPNVTASDALGVITITGKAVPGSGNVINGFRAAHEVLFDVILSDNLTAFSTVVAQNPDPGCGTKREIAKLEEIYKGNRGVTNRVIFPTSTNVQYAWNGAATGYETYAIEHDQPQHTNTEGSVPAQTVTVVALDKDATNKAAFDTALDAIIAALK